MEFKDVAPKDFDKIANKPLFLLRRFNPSPEPYEIGRDKTYIYIVKDWKAWLKYVDDRRYDPKDLWSYQK